MLSPFDFSLMQRIREKRCDALSAPEQAAGGLQAVDSLQWYVLGAVFASPYRNLLKLDLAKDGVAELDLLFAGGPKYIAGCLKARIELPSSWDMLLRTNIVSYC